MIDSSSREQHQETLHKQQLAVKQPSAILWQYCATWTHLQSAVKNTDKNGQNSLLPRITPIARSKTAHDPRSE